MVAAELGVDTPERRVTVGLRLLDTVRGKTTYQRYCSRVSLQSPEVKVSHVGNVLRLSVKTAQYARPNIIEILFLLESVPS